MQSMPEKSDERPSEDILLQARRERRATKKMFEVQNEMEDFIVHKMKSFESEMARSRIRE